MADHKLLMPHLLKWEGGFSNNSNDPGGATMRGVTLATYERWCRLHGCPRPTVARLKAMDKDTWERIYKELFWDKCLGDHIRDQRVANVIVDWYFNAGTNAIKRVQTHLGLTADGIFGKMTLSAVNGRNPDDLFAQLKALRVGYYTWLARNPRYKVFLKGWLNRVFDLR